MANHETRYDGEVGRAYFGNRRVRRVVVADTSWL